MFTHNPGLYESVLNYSFEKKCTSSQAEQHFFGFDHYQVGLEAVKEWKLPDRFNDYMGLDLTMPRTEQLADAVLQSLMAANYLVSSAGIGAKEIDDYDIKKSALIGFGLNETLCEHLLHDQFIEGLMENDTYKLCASI